MSSQDKFDADKFSQDLHDKIHRDIHDRTHEDVQSQFRKATRGTVHVHWGGRSSGLWPGLILVIVGTVVLLDHMGLISSDRLWKFWPVLLLVLGVVKLVEPFNRVFGAVLTLVGALFLLNNLGYTHLSWWDMWPIALICAGLMLIWNRFEMPKLPKLSPMASSAGPNDINEFALFGAVERRITVGNFTGGTASATFGGVDLDFRSADIEGEQAVLYLEAIFGGIEITVPDRWAVVYEGQSIFGGFSDETRPPLPEVPGAPPKKRLILRGRAIFGGISVKN